MLLDLPKDGLHPEILVAALNQATPEVLPEDVAQDVLTDTKVQAMQNINTDHLQGHPWEVKDAASLDTLVFHGLPESFRCIPEEFFN